MRKFGISMRNAQRVESGGLRGSQPRTKEDYTPIQQKQEQQDECKCCCGITLLEGSVSGKVFACIACGAPALEAKSRQIHYRPDLNLKHPHSDLVRVPRTALDCLLWTWRLLVLTSSWRPSKQDYWTCLCLVCWHPKLCVNRRTSVNGYYRATQWLQISMDEIMEPTSRGRCHCWEGLHKPRCCRKWQRFYSCHGPLKRRFA